MRNPIQLLKDSVGILKENPALFFGILLVPALLSVVASIFEPAQNTGVDASEWIVFAVMTVVTAVANIFMGIALILAFQNRSLTVKSAYSGAKSFFWRYLGLSILTSIVITIGFILLIIPGVIVSVWLAFATFILVLERTEIIEAMKKSKEYVKGKWWEVFGRLIAGSLVALLLLAIVFAVLSPLPIDVLVENIVMTFIGMLIAPIAVGYMYLMYQDLKGVPMAQPSDPVAFTGMDNNPPATTTVA